MTTVYKYTVFPSQEAVEVEMPEDAMILSFGVDGLNRPCIWALVNTENPIEKREFFCVGTGWNLDEIFAGEPVVYAGSVTDAMGMVWHLFDTEAPMI